MKRMKIWLAALFCVMMCMAAECALAGQSGYYFYEDNGDGTCTITDYGGKSIAPVFPDTLDSLTVTGIGKNVFRLADNGMGYMALKASRFRIA